MLSEVPAGEYRLVVRHQSGEGWIMAGVGGERDPSALLTEPVAKVTDTTVLRFPVDVRSLVVRGDEDAHRYVDRIGLQPLNVLPDRRKPVRGYALRAVRYPGATVFFMDEAAFPEPSAFWIRGASESAVVLLSDQPLTSQTLLFRNAAVTNVVTVSSGSWREELRMRPEEERRVDIPADQSREGVLVRIRCASGFRPSDADSQNRDTRFLGVYVRVP